MKVTFDTRNKFEVEEVKKLLGILGEVKEEPKKIEVKEKPKDDKIPSEDKKEQIGVSIDDLRNEAKEATKRTDRATVKSVINEFAPKLTEVDEKDYPKLLEKLKAL